MRTIWAGVLVGTAVAAWLAGGAAEASCTVQVGTVAGSTGYDGPANGDDYAWALALDGSGNVVVAGYEVGTSGGFNWRVRKYDATLSTLLAATDYNGPGNGDDFCYAVGVDGGGNVVVAGWETGTTGGFNWRVRKYDATLSTLLASTDYNGPGNGTDRVTALVVDGSGNVVVAGSEAGTAGGDNWRVRKYNGALSTLVGSTDYDGPGNSFDFANAVAVDGGGNVVVAGWELDGAGNNNWRIRKYGPTLSTLLATIDYNDPGNGESGATAVTIDAGGNVVVAGYETAAAGGWNWRVSRYNPTLSALLGTTDYNGSGNLDDAARAVSLDEAGNVVVAGWETGATGGVNWRLRKYSPTLSAVLTGADYDGPASGGDGAMALRLDGTGNLLVAGYEAGTTGGVNWRVRRYPCTEVAAAPAEALFAFPNPVTQDGVTLAVGLAGPARDLTVDVFNAAMQRIYHGAWQDVEAAPGTVTIAGLKGWAPGVYLVRVTATYADGSKQTFPVRKLVVKR